MKQREVMVYLMTGFLDSGKTQFLQFTLTQNYFQIRGATLLILCEEGEEEYDEMLLKKHRTVVETVENPEDLTEEWLRKMDEKHHPARVVIEYNGMWRVSEFEAMTLPTGWMMEQKLTTVDASTFQVYLNNMKPLFVEMVRGSEMVLFNRCTDTKPLAGYRRSVKVVSPQAEVIFEDEEGEIEDIFADSVPFDLEQPVVEIRPEDYGIWYVDAMEHEERYDGKTVEFVARALRPKSFPANTFLPGRMAMTCCADDTSFLGYVCKVGGAMEPKAGQWVKVRGKISYEELKMYRGRGPVITVECVEPAEEIKELVYFN